MRTILPEKVERARLLTGYYGSPHGSGPYGAFLLTGPCGAELAVIADPGEAPIVEGWEHVSVSIKHRPPNWQEMCFIKNLFWLPEETVVQFHPPESVYVNIHRNCLHLWRHPHIKLPPIELL